MEVSNTYMLKRLEEARANLRLIDEKYVTLVEQFHEVLAKITALDLSRVEACRRIEVIEELIFQATQRYLEREPLEE